MKIYFEKISIDSSQKMVGGFSQSMFVYDDSESSQVNNCKGGNKKVGCGAKKRKKNRPASGTNSNCSGNCVTGCGG